MKLLLSLILLLSLNFIKCKDEDFSFEKNDNLLILTDKNAQLSILNNECIFIFFYAPWCGHCQKFKPIFEETVKNAKEMNLSCNFAVVNSIKNEEISKQFEVEGFPTLILITKGEKFIYENERNSGGIIKYIQKHSKGIYKKINTLKEFDEIKKLDKIILLNTLDSKTNSYKNFIEMAEDLDECEFVICESEECREKFKKDVLIINKNEINYYSNYNKSDNLNEINIDNLYSFYLKFSFVNGGDLNQNSLKYILSESKPTFIYFRNKSTNIWEKEFNEIVEKYKEKFIFLSSDIEGKEAYLNAAYILRIKKRDLPSVFLFDNLNKDEANKFKYNKESLSMENFEKFLEEYKNEKIKEVIDSEEIPDESKQIYNYRIIVGKSFETEVINYKENVLLFSFGEDCEMCEKYLKDFDNLAKKYKEENIKFTIINLDENEIKNIYPSKYPSIYLFKKENKNEPILFEMEFEKLEYWIKNTLNIGKDEINDEL